MSDLSLVRTLIGDNPQYQVAEEEGDGLTVEFLMPNAPIYPGTAKVRVGGSLKTVGVDYAIDELLGLVTFTGAPGVNATVGISSQYTMLSDSQIADLLAQYDFQAARLAAADALDIIASSEVLIQKRIKMMDFQTDGPAEATALRAHAKSLREQVFSAKMDESDFEIAEQVNDGFGLKEVILKDFIKGL